MEPFVLVGDAEDTLRVKKRQRGTERDVTRWKHFTQHICLNRRGGRGGRYCQEGQEGQRSCCYYCCCCCSCQEDPSRPQSTASIELLQLLIMLYVMSCQQDGSDILKLCPRAHVAGKVYVADGVAYNAMLNQTDVATGANKFYQLQIIQRSPTSCTLVLDYGRIGTRSFLCPSIFVCVCLGLVFLCLVSDCVLKNNRLQLGLRLRHQDILAGAQAGH